MKIFYKAISLTIGSVIVMAQLGCSTPASTSTGQVKSTENNSSVVTDNKKVIVAQNSFLMTQKDASGISNPIVPEDLESIKINGKIFTTSDISVIKTSFKVKDTGNLTISYKDSRFFIDGATDSTMLDISFKLKNVDYPINLPSFTLAKISGDLRVEITKNDAGQITSVKGGVNNNGALDTNQPVFSYDVSAKTFTLTSPNGEQTKYMVDDVTKNLNVDTKVEEKLTKEQAKSQIDTTAQDVKKPTIAAPFVGKWKYSILGYKVAIKLREGAEQGKMDFSGNFSSSAQNFNSSFNGVANYLADSSNVNSLLVNTNVSDVKLKVKVELQGDNSLLFTLTESNKTELAGIVNIAMPLERDTSN
ncbi:MAG: hypothetical protein H7263_05055 [Candidatus Sericytochromatia bacterium]|nr:hypothetical protein [Candidatus Sericytochromatia bacterium]